MPFLFTITLVSRCQKRDVNESHYGQNISSRSSQRLEQMVDHGMRDTKGVHTIRDSCSHREKGAESEDVGRNGSKHVKGTINHQLQKFEPLNILLVMETIKHVHTKSLT